MNPFIPKLRKSPYARLFLDAVNVSALAIMAATTFDLCVNVLIDWPAIIIFSLSMIVTFTFKKVSSFWVVIAGAVLGYVLLNLF